ncbi:MAG: hypothetical protein HXY30_10300 [Pseudorhodoplanes sp.]|nr:hypothetical protein [Pseudorhodoplanes sp.]
MIVKALLAAFLLLAGLGGTSFAADIRKGATVQVKANALWFEDTGKLARWQRMKKKSDAATLAKLEQSMLRAREAWQFVNAQTVKVLDFDARTGRVRVEMTGEGRMQGTQWVVDEGTVE